MVHVGTITCDDSTSLPLPVQYSQGWLTSACLCRLWACRVRGADAIIEVVRLLTSSPVRQAMLPLWSGHPAQPLQHVCKLHPVPGGHYRGHPEAGNAALVQGVRALSAAAQALGAGCPGVQRAAHAVHQAIEGSTEGVLPGSSRATTTQHSQ